ncbi:dihydrouridine synthase (dus) protein [Besnoitia besnoiti]|uniref:Dihydrouridine synthase (Dus) protein n=1 Tax=Besnoitia besnoiti TaxID=94643 RepID=A0A2A9M6N0_BESBE|nr:dihydrouridine synthase (dus) protein [Besnoitia besnoiti]PFH31070.1 dihydrouridine synthase (dus) protein [Besnoitia besnoiti]
MDHTTTHWRHLMSLMSRRMTLYTEMVSVPPAPLSPHGDNDLPAAIKRRLREEAASLSTVPNDVVLQVGAGTLEGAVAVARLLRSQALCQTGSEERSRGETRRGRFFVVNLNCGCPSPRVASGSFGLLLMEDPARVADICCALFDGLSNATARISARFDSAMSSSTCSGQGNDGRVTQLKESLGVRGFQVSVKCRVGIEEDRRFLRSGANKLAADTAAAAPSGSPSCTYEKLAEFIASVAEHSPVRHFVVHARPGVLVGKLSPTENRSIPERRPEWVYRLCADFPHLSFTLNGGIESFEEAEDHLVKTADALAGIMVGRSLLEKPWYWGSQADKFIASQELRRRRCLAAELSSGRGGTTGARLARARREGGGVGERAAPGECTVRDNPGGSGRGCTRRDGEAKPARAEVLEQYARYADEVERNQGLSPAAEERQEEGTARLKFGREEEGQPKRSSRAALLKPLLNLFAGEPGSRAFKNSLQLGAGSSGASCSSEAGHRTAARGQTGARTNLGECGKQMLAPRGRGLQFPRTETAGEIIRKAMEVVPVDLLV